MSKFTIDLDEDDGDETITAPAPKATKAPKVSKAAKASEPAPEPPPSPMPEPTPLSEVAARFRTDVAPVSRAFSPPASDADMIDINRVKDELVLAEAAYREASAEHADAKIAEIRAEIHLSQTKLRIDRELRAYYAKPEVKKPNEDHIKNEVALHPDVEQSAGALRDCEVALLIAKHKLDTVSNRQRVVIMLSALTRQEIAAFS